MRALLRLRQATHRAPHLARDVVSLLTLPWLEVGRALVIRVDEAVGRHAVEPDHQHVGVIEASRPRVRMVLREVVDGRHHGLQVAGQLEHLMRVRVRVRIRVRVSAPTASALRALQLRRCSFVGRWLPSSSAGSLALLS